MRAVIIAIAFEQKEPNRRKLTHFHSPELEKRVARLSKALRIETSCGLKEIFKIEVYFKIYQITVIDNYGDILYIGSKNKKFIYLLNSNNHFDAITNINLFYNKENYCDFCKKAFNHRNHKCDNICKTCFRLNCQNDNLEIRKCKCDKIIYNQICERIHNENYCKLINICEVCGIFKNKNHVCKDQIWCKNCKCSVKIDSHECYMLKYNDEKIKDEFKGYIFFDYESTQENEYHLPNLICVKCVCSNCLNQIIENCDICKQYTFENNINFCNWLFRQKNWIAIAHNMKGYDGVFLMNYLLNNTENSTLVPKCICKGTKILTISYNKVKVIDSLSFITMSLEKFPKTFGLIEMKKGYFPHLFNTEKNQNYIGCYPPKSMYGIENFTKDKLRDFNIWYDKVKDEVFNFKEELYAYCWSDVDILSRGCLEFRKLYMKKTEINGVGIDPFRNSLTIASLCHTIFKRNVLKENTLAYIPKNFERISSKKALAWLDWIAYKENIYIRHARNKGEVKFGNFSVDGLCEALNVIYEFHGCFYHGCPKCFKAETFNSRLNCTMGFIYNRHLNRIELLQRKGCKIVEIWECEYDRLVREDENLYKFLKNVDYSSPLLIKDALFGGRTEAINLHYKMKDEEKGRYYDIRSLYPSVQKNRIYPIGHPIIYNDNFPSVSKILGFIKCRILPPKDLFLPVLPEKNRKLVFPLCHTCAFENNKSKCNHSEQKRALIGTWTSMEIQEALIAGYRILKIFEIWHWEKYSENVFTEYVNMFLKSKQEATGFPQWVKSQEDKEKYVKDFEINEGIKLDVDKIEKNPGARYISKLSLNSNWGRLGMNPDNKIQIKIIKKKSDWFDLIFDTRYLIHDVNFFNDSILQVFYSENVENDITDTITDTLQILMQLL